MKIAIEIQAVGRLCGCCCHKFKGRDSNGMRWMCNMFRTESENGHTGTCLNTNNKLPLRCKQCIDAEIGDEK